MSFDLFNLTDRVAVVTGAGKGIGKEIALALADAGANVVVASRTAADIDNTAAAVAQKGRKSLAVPTDVRVAEQINNLIAKTVEKFNKIDIFVNNAGGSFVVSTMELTEGGWDAIIRENLKSVFLCSQAVAKVMIKQQKGAIINMASMTGLDAHTACAPYGAAKAAVISFTKTLACDLAKYNIRVNAVAPGLIDTAGVAPQFDSQKEILQSIPLGRLGKPGDIVGGIIYLASDASSYITGETIVIDGGTTIKPTLKYS